MNIKEYILENRSKKKLHSIAEKNLKILLKEVNPNSFPVSEISVDGGRVDLKYYLPPLNKNIHFEIFASKTRVPQDLRLLEQSKSEVQITILIDKEIDPSVSSEYFRKRPINPFPSINLSELFVESKLNDFKSKIKDIIKNFQEKEEIKEGSLSIEIPPVQRFRGNENKYLFFRIKLKNISKKTIENIIVKQEIYDKNNNLWLESSECIWANIEDIKSDLNPGQDALINVLSLKVINNNWLLSGSPVDEFLLGNLLDTLSSIKIRFESILGHKFQDKGYLDSYSRNLKIKIQITGKDIPVLAKCLMFQICTNHSGDLEWVFSNYNSENFQKNLKLQYLFYILDYWINPFFSEEQKLRHLHPLLDFSFKEYLHHFDKEDKEEINSILSKISNFDQEKIKNSKRGNEKTS